MTRFVFSIPLLGISLLTLTAIDAAPIEVGTVKWGRDLQVSLTASAESKKPVLVLFQEVPGCAGCRQFGKEVLSHPQLVEAIESLFEPVVVYNNQPGKDAETLARFKEPAWNYQVIRFLDAEAKDIIPRRDKIWTVEAVAQRMVEALEAANQEVPLYLQALATDFRAETIGKAAFAMFCFWTGEQRFGGLDGVLTTEAGWLEGREVTLVTFDRSVISFSELLNAAVSFDCARKVYPSTEAHQARAEESRLPVAKLTDAYRPAASKDQKRQLRGTPYQKLSLSPIQATKVNAFARSDAAMAQSWLSLREREQL